MSSVWTASWSGTWNEVSIVQYSFQPPKIPIGRGNRLGPRRPMSGLWSRLESIERGQTVWKDGAGVWHTGTPGYLDLLNAQESFLGGRTYTVSEALGLELEAEGFVVNEL